MNEGKENALMKEGGRENSPWSKIVLSDRRSRVERKRWGEGGEMSWKKNTKCHRFLCHSVFNASRRETCVVYSQNCTSYQFNDGSSKNSNNKNHRKTNILRWFIKITIVKIRRLRSAFMVVLQRIIVKLIYYSGYQNNHYKRSKGKIVYFSSNFKIATAF